MTLKPVWKKRHELTGDWITVLGIFETTLSFNLQCLNLRRRIHKKCQPSKGDLKASGKLCSFLA